MRRLAWSMRRQNLVVGPIEVDTEFASTAAVDGIAGDASSVVRGVFAAAELMSLSIVVLVSDWASGVLLARCGVLI
jgi:hypothetical protein